MIAKPIRMQNDSERDGDNGNRGTSVITRTKPKTKKPNLYRVLLLNDDYTPMEFVIHILERFFQKDREACHPHHASCSQSRRRRMRCIYIRGSRNEGEAGDGFRPAAPASAAMRHGKEVRI